MIATARDRAAIVDMAGAQEICADREISDRLGRRDIDAVVDLIVMNSNATALFDEFHAVNVERVQALVGQAESAAVGRVVLITSFHSADPDNDTGYAASKRALEKWVAETAPQPVRLVVLPKIAPDANGARRRIWQCLAAVKPAAFFEAAAAAIERAILSAATPDEPIWVSSIGHDRAYRLVSRAIDIGFAIAIFVGLGWAMILLAVAIRLEGTGPALFRQRRVGRHERPFTLYKFRTMAVGTNEGATHEIGAAAVSRVGHFLRRTKLDELPQAWNILRGDLALVGPRPCLFVQDELIARRRAAGIFSLTPGLTGLAQVNGIDMSDPAELVRWEVLYCRIRGLLLDVRIVLQTFLGRGGGDRVAT